MLPDLQILAYEDFCTSYDLEPAVFSQEVTKATIRKTFSFPSMTTALCSGII